MATQGRLAQLLEERGICAKRTFEDARSSIRQIRMALALDRSWPDPIEIFQRSGFILASAVPIDVSWSSISELRPEISPVHPDSHHHTLQ